jgi:hypothetical protein
VTLLIEEHIEGHEHNTYHQGGISDVERWPFMRAYVPHDKVGYFAQLDTIDEISDGAAAYKPEREVQPPLPWVAANEIHAN